MNRRGFITGLVSFVAAPAIVRAGSLMPIRAVLLAPTWRLFYRGVPIREVEELKIYSNRVIRTWMDVQAIRDRNVLNLFEDAA